MKESIFWAEKVEKKPQLEEIVLKAIEKIECGGYSLGEGMTASICGLEGYPDVCVKIINKEKPINGGEEEMNFLSELSRKSYPVPSPVCAAKTEKAEYVFMEIIDGLSIKDLTKNGKNEAENYLTTEILKNIDFNSFFKELKMTIERMHSEGIYHRDLHSGNVMVDKNGKPVIIDLGTAKKSRLLEEDPYIDDRIGSSTIFPSDDNKVVELRGILGSYLKEIGHFNKQ